MLIDLKGVDKRFDAKGSEVVALEHVDLQIDEGEFVSLLGPSGCGKSTLMRIIAGLHAATSGSVSVAGRPVTEPIPDVGIVFQSPLLLSWRSVLDNVLLPAEMAGLPRRKYVDRAHQLLENAGLAGFENKEPRTLSGGMKQRVALCRALLLDPPLLLMDEPFGALDAMTRDDMNLALARLYQADASATGTRKTVVFVTHSIPEAVFLADRVCVMSARPGRIKTTVDVPLARPRDLEVRVSDEFAHITAKLYGELNVTAGVPAGNRD